VYKKIKRQLTLPRHEKLCEESQQDPVISGVTYNASYLGCCSVIKPSGEEATSEAVKNIVQAAKKDNRKLTRVALLVSVRGIRMSELETERVTFDFSIYRISYCSADSTFTHVFSFIAVNKQELLECHAFLAKKQKIAQAATLTIAQAFNLAFNKWKEQSKEKKEERMKESVCEVCRWGCRLGDYEDTRQGGEKLVMDDAGLANSKGYSDDSEPPLIDLRSPTDTAENEANTTCGGHYQELHYRIQRLEEDKSSPQLENATSSPSQHNGYYSSSPLDSPLPSPLHGSCLTPRKLMSPTCSPLPRTRTNIPPPSPLARL